MFTMAKIKDGETYLAQHLSANDYYCEGERVTGLWQGRAAERLGLTGEIHANDKAFQNLRNNRKPDGTGKLTTRDSEGRVRFFDFQCSAQKSVSVMAVTMGDSRLLDAHDKAAEAAFAELEKFAACQSNTVFQRRNKATGNVVAGKFRHTASRALDPQVHSHFVVANATWDQDKQVWKALTEYEMVKAIRYAGKVYQNELARSCKALGYEITSTTDKRGQIAGFEIAGVSEGIRRRFSKRRAQVELGIADFEKRNGRMPTTPEVHAITVGSRNAKLAEITTPEVLAAQRAQLSPLEQDQLSTLKAEALAREFTGPNPTRERESLRLSVSNIFERRSVALGHEVLAEALNQNLGFVELSRLHAQAASCDLVALDGKAWLGGSFATPLGLKQERWAVGFIGRTRGMFPELGHVVLAPKEKLSPEQRRAVAELLGSTDQVVSLHGAAGVGKSTVLRALHAALTANEYQVLICAPTSSAADTLRRDGLPGATTVSALLHNGSALGITGRTVLMVDEAALASNHQGAELLKMAERRGIRVVFLGDSRQHTAVEAGDFLRLLEVHSPLQRVELTDIRRQTVHEYRDVVGLMAAGLARDGLQRLDAMGWVHGGKADYLRAAATDFLRASGDGRNLDQVLAVTPTWEENHAFTAMLRRDLKASGILGAGEELVHHEPLSWTKGQLARSASYNPGLVVHFNRNMAGFKRGQFAEVTRVDAGKVWVHGEVKDRILPLGKEGFSVAKARTLEVCAGDRILVQANVPSAKLINGQRLSVVSVNGGIIETADGRRIDTQNVRQFTYGYAVTSHQSQSKTADHVIVAAARLDAKSAYVACSRGRLSCSLHTPDKEALFECLPEGKRVSALDLLKTSIVTNVADRRSPWSRVDQILAARSLETTRVASSLVDSWWRGILSGVAEWSKGFMPWRSIDKTADVGRGGYSR